MRLLQALLVLSLVLAFAASSNSSYSQNRSAPVAVGDLAPDFTLEDQNKNKVTLSAAREKSLVVLVFYRGYW